MKLNVSTTFDVSQIADSNTYKEIEPFFDYINSFTSDVVQAFNKQITFSDNLNFTLLPLQLKHGTSINIGKLNPIGLFIQSENPYSSYALSTRSDSSKLFTLFFKNSQNVQAQSAIWQAGTIVRYKVQDTSSFSVGDTLNISGFGTANNNGTFPIVEIDSDNKYLYLNNRKRSSATGDESKTSYVGNTLVSYPVILGVIHG